MTISVNVSSRSYGNCCKSFYWGELIGHQDCQSINNTAAFCLMNSRQQNCTIHCIICYFVSIGGFSSYYKWSKNLCPWKFMQRSSCLYFGFGFDSEFWWRPQDYKTTYLPEVIIFSFRNLMHRNSFQRSHVYDCCTLTFCVKTHAATCETTTIFSATRMLARILHNITGLFARLLVQ